MLDPEFPRKGHQPQGGEGERQPTIRAHTKIVCVDLPKFISSKVTYICASRTFLIADLSLEFKSQHMLWC